MNIADCCEFYMDPIWPGKELHILLIESSPNRQTDTLSIPFQFLFLAAQLKNDFFAKGHANGALDHTNRPIALKTPTGQSTHH